MSQEFQNDQDLHDFEETMESYSKRFKFQIQSGYTFSIFLDFLETVLS